VEIVHLLDESRAKNEPEGAVSGATSVLQRMFRTKKEFTPSTKVTSFTQDSKRNGRGGGGFPQLLGAANRTVDLPLGSPFLKTEDVLKDMLSLLCQKNKSVFNVWYRYKVEISL
jgi:hypothetical protein